MVIVGMVLSGVGTAQAHNSYAPPKNKAKTTARQQAPVPFLTLPFEPSAEMSVLSGWYYSSSGGFHGGIDYIKGNVNNVRGWQTFAVIAAADGEACGNCTSRQGNAVWVKHNINGQTYYTYYGHLASIAPGIPIGSQSRTVYVKRGQFLGWAGDTGSKGALHLHFALYNAASRPIEPYGIGKLRQYYPKPTDATPGIGWFLGD
jgi:murein DD-endopeptidase MepM/ murein hydrolase activator NlpD